MGLPRRSTWARKILHLRDLDEGEENMELAGVGEPTLKGVAVVVVGVQVEAVIRVQVEGKVEVAHNLLVRLISIRTCTEC